MTAFRPPRDYQIAELTRGVQLPLPKLQRRHVTSVADLIITAWQDLLKTQAVVMKNGGETDVNALMKTKINRICGQKTEWSTLVSGVSLGTESMNYDASSIEKRPDLSFHLTNRLFDLPLVVECKLIDIKKGVDLYCEHGLLRFLEGGYAWYAQEAIMLAYVRDKSTLLTDLVPYLQKNQQEVPDPFLTEKLPDDASCHKHSLGESRHGRMFHNNPGPIAVWHLWLS